MAKFQKFEKNNREIMKRKVPMHIKIQIFMEQLIDIYEKTAYKSMEKKKFVSQT